MQIISILITEQKLEAEKSWDNPLKRFDTISLITYGYGLKPFYILGLGKNFIILFSIFIILFSIIYATSPKMYFEKRDKIPIKFNWQGLRIYIQSNQNEENLRRTIWMLRILALIDPSMLVQEYSMLKTEYRIPCKNWLVGSCSGYSWQLIRK